MDTKSKLDVQFQYLEDLTQVNIDILSLNGDPLTAQEILDAVAETLLLKYDNYEFKQKKTLNS